MNPIILFDGDCSFCNRSVQFILKKERRKTFLFASLQSDVGKKLFKQYKVPETTDSLILIKNGKAYWYSGGAIRIAYYLKGIYPLLQLFLIVPYPIRDWVYRRIAKRRHLIVKERFCLVPSAEDKKRIIL